MGGEGSGFGFGFGLVGRVPLQLAPLQQLAEELAGVALQLLLRVGKCEKVVDALLTLAGIGSSLDLG